MANFTRKADKAGARAMIDHVIASGGKGGYGKQKGSKSKTKALSNKFGDTARHPSGRKWRSDDKGTAFESGPYPKK